MSSPHIYRSNKSPACTKVTSRQREEVVQSRSLLNQQYSSTTVSFLSFFHRKYSFNVQIKANQFKCRIIQQPVYDWPHALLPRPDYHNRELVIKTDKHVKKKKNKKLLNMDKGFDTHEVVYHLSILRYIAKVLRNSIHI